MPRHWKTISEEEFAEAKLKMAGIEITPLTIKAFIAGRKSNQRRTAANGIFKNPLPGEVVDSNNEVNYFKRGFRSLE